jgi:hypothetical protein
VVGYGLTYACVYCFFGSFSASATYHEIALILPSFFCDEASSNTMAEDICGFTCDNQHNINSACVISMSLCQGMAVFPESSIQVKNLEA